MGPEGYKFDISQKSYTMKSATARYSHRRWILHARIIRWE